MTLSYSKTAEHLLESLPQKSRLAILGSVSFHHYQSEDDCVSLGNALAKLPDLLLITGGMTGVGETIGRSFCSSRLQLAQPPDVYHILPNGFPKWDYGDTLFAGESLGQRREILARVSDLYIVVEGGPGTRHEAETAIGNGAIVIPLGRSGGYAQKLYLSSSPSELMSKDDWESIGDEGLDSGRVADSLSNLVQACSSDGK